jgi:hypothetical protein
MIQFIGPILKSLTMSGILEKGIKAATSHLTDDKEVAEVTKAVVKKTDAPWYLSKRVRSGILVTALICCNDVFKLGITSESLYMISGIWGLYVGFKSHEQKG